MNNMFEKTISVRMSDSDVFYLKEQAEKEGITVSQLLRRLIRDARFPKEVC